MFDNSATRQTTQPTDSQIDVLMSDWLGNLRMKQEGNYTHKGKGGIKIQRDTTMRDYLIGDVSHMDELDLIKNARIAAEKVVNTVSPRPTSVQVGSDDSFHRSADGRDEITLATNYFDDKDIEKEEKVDIMLGLAAHEAAHAAYTDSESVEEHIVKESPDIQQLKHNIWNIIEDERIEYHLGEDRPGLIDNIAATKGYYFDRMIEQMKTNGQMPTEPLPKLLAAITLAIRYPSQMSRDQVIDNFDDLDEIRRTLTPYPLTPEDAWEATDRVLDIVRKRAEKEMQNQQPQQGNQDQQPSGQNQGQQGSSASGQKQSDQGDQSQDSASQQGQSLTKKEIEQAIANALSSEQGKNVMNAIQKDMNKNDKNDQSQAIDGEDEQDYVNNDDSERACSGLLGGSGQPDTFIRKPKGDREAYCREMKAVRAYIPAMAKALSCKSQQRDYVLKSQPKGRLDTSKLVAYVAGSDKIFSREGAITCSSASVCMLIDESGSMRSDLKRSARRAAILVNEAIKRIKNVNFFCYGYTSELIKVYSEGGKTSPWALSGTDNIAGTPTGLAMHMCSKRVRRFTNDQVLMLVLTDGCPDNTRLVMEQDNELRKKGFIPIGVGILTNAVVNTFRDSIVMNDIADLPVEMGKLTKKRLSKMLVRTDSEQ